MPWLWSVSASHNLWWTNPDGWEARDQDLREARLNAIRHYNPRPLDDIQAGSLYLLIGPRRSGKSVSIKRAIANLIRSGIAATRITFCPCEGLTAQDLRRMIKLATDVTPGVAEADRYWFFDEITYVRDWVDTLKQLRDQTALREGCVVATGSSAAKLREAQGGLGGREGTAGGVRLQLPMAFRDFVRELYAELAAALPAETIALGDLQTDQAAHYLRPLAVFVDEISIAWERYLHIGGFPRAVVDGLTGTDVREGTANSLWNILVGDVLHVGSMSDRDVKALIRRLVESMGSPLSVSGIAETLNIGSRNTIVDRIDRLCASLYSWRASTSHDGVRAVQGGQSKLYFIDPLVTRLPTFRDARLQEPDITYLSEQQVGVAILRDVARRNIAAIMDEATVLVRRNPDSGSEIDFVGDLVETPIESKYVSQKWKQERAALDEHYERGIVATRDILDLDDHIWAVPAGLLVWSIDG